MAIPLNATHDPSRRSHVAAANDAGNDFPIQNLPIGVFRTDGSEARGGIAIGDRILDLAAATEGGLFEGSAREAATAASGSDLTALLMLGLEGLSTLRARAADLLDEAGGWETKVARHLVPLSAAVMELPAKVTAFTDMCVSTYHIGRRNGNDEHGQPICPPMFRTIPVGYDGRASSVVVSGTPVRRPNGTWQSAMGKGEPEFGPEPRLDYELELAMWVAGPANAQGEPIAMAEAATRIAGFSLLNDWSARGIQFWETMLGPFLGKSIATTVSPWIVTAEALAPFRTHAFDRPPSDPPLPAHLTDAADQETGGIDLVMEAWLETSSGLPTRMCRTNFRHMYWTPAQMVAHHVSNGCSLGAGNLIGSGTCSGPQIEAAGCLIETLSAGPLTLADGSPHGWLEDGETVMLRARAEREGFRSIGFGECRGTVQPALSWP